MPKKVKKVIKAKSAKIKPTLIHQSFKRTPHHTDAYIQKYFFAGLIIILAVFGLILYKGLMQPTDINVITTGDGGDRRKTIKCSPGYVVSSGRCVRPVKSAPTK